MLSFLDINSFNHSAFNNTISKITEIIIVWRANSIVTFLDLKAEII
jgi:hypothetical protein